MKVKKIKHKLRKVPVELSLMVLYETVRVPRVHFVKLYRTYNGGLKDAPLGMPGRYGNGELGVEEVDPLSGACKLSKLLMQISEASKWDWYTRHLTCIPRNPTMFPINRNPIGVPHIKVDIHDDLFCFSSNGQGPFFPGERFTGGVSLYHEVAKNIHRICMGLPNYDLAARNYRCQDCGRDYNADTRYFRNDRIEFCSPCIGIWFARLKNLEQVYIIVPGLPRAQGTDKQYMSRYCALGSHNRVYAEVLQRDPTCQLASPIYRFQVDTGKDTGTAITSHIIEDFGPKGPRSFDGDGITLYEVAAWDIPAQPLSFMHALVFSYAKTRVVWTNNTAGKDPPPLPVDPRICGGAVEFKFLSYAVGP